MFDIEGHVDSLFLNDLVSLWQMHIMYKLIYFNLTNMVLRD